MDFKAYCPLMKGTCLNGFVKGMPETEDGARTTCALFIRLLGKNPQTGEAIDDPGCALRFLPLMVLEGTDATRRVGAAADKVASEVRRGSGLFVGALPPHTRKQLLEGPVVDPGTITLERS